MKHPIPRKIYASSVGANTFGNINKNHRKYKNGSLNPLVSSFDTPTDVPLQKTNNIDIFNMKRIQTPEGVAALMRELWEKYQHGETLNRGNVFFVDLPPVSEEERKKT